MDLFVERTRLSWAQACIILQEAALRSEAPAPNDSTGTNIFADGTFDSSLGSAGDLSFIFDTYHPSMSADVLTIFGVPVFKRVERRAMAVTSYPDYAALQPYSQGMSYTLLGTLAGPRDLAHELGHILALISGHLGNEPYFIFPPTPADVSIDFRDKVDYHVNTLRRFSQEIVQQARSNSFLFQQ